MFAKTFACLLLVCGLLYNFSAYAVCRNGKSPPKLSREDSCVENSVNRCNCERFDCSCCTSLTSVAEGIVCTNYTYNWLQAKVKFITTYNDIKIMSETSITTSNLIGFCPSDDVEEELKLLIGQRFSSCYARGTINICLNMAISNLTTNGIEYIDFGCNSTPRLSYGK